jgi:hypothetical protein
MNDLLPAPVDVSAGAVQKAVVSNTLQHYASLVPLFVGIPASAVLGLFFPVAGMVAGASMAFLGISAGVVNYCFRYDAQAARHLDKIRELQRRYVAEQPDRLRKALAECCSNRGPEQLEELERSYQDFCELLERRFSHRGLSYNRFLAVTEQVRAAALAKLQMVVDNKKAIASIPERDLTKQLARLPRESEDARLIRERLDHRQAVLDLNDRLHTSVEETLTRISELTVQIAQIGNGDGEVQFENYLGELQALAKRASGFQKEV